MTLCHFTPDEKHNPFMYKVKIVIESSKNAYIIGKVNVEFYYQSDVSRIESFRQKLKNFLVEES